MMSMFPWDFSELIKNSCEVNELGTWGMFGTLDLQKTSSFQEVEGPTVQIPEEMSERRREPFRALGFPSEQW